MNLYPARGVWATFAGVVTLIFLAAGCGDKGKTGTAAAPGTAPAPGAQAGSVTLTPEQEAARKHAIEQGPAIEAALKRQQGN